MSKRYVWLECGVECASYDELTSDVLTRYADAYDAANPGDGAPTLVDTVMGESIRGDNARWLARKAGR